MRSSITDRVATLTVRRRCLVCEWIGTVEEPEGTDDIGPECVRCHAPTERIEVRSRSLGSLHQESACGGPWSPRRLERWAGARRGAIPSTATRNCAGGSSRTVEP